LTTAKFLVYSNKRTFVHLLSNPMTDDTLPKGERTRQVIEEAAYSLFLEQGYSATSMRQIAARAGIALGGIYNHFEGKDDIFEAIMLDKHPYKQILPVISAAPGDTAEAFIRNAAQAFVDELGRRPDFLRLMFIEIVEFNTNHAGSATDPSHPNACRELTCYSPCSHFTCIFGYVFLVLHHGHPGCRHHAPRNARTGVGIICRYFPARHSHNRGMNAEV
jgi:hypothetical protein